MKTQYARAHHKTEYADRGIWLLQQSSNVSKGNRTIMKYPMICHASEYNDRSIKLPRCVSPRLLRFVCRLNRKAGEARDVIATRSRIPDMPAIQNGAEFPHRPADSRPPRRNEMLLGARVIVLVLLFCLGSVGGWAQQNDQQQMRGLDEQVQEVKADVLSIAAELSQLEEKLLYPSGTQFAIFVALAKGDLMRLDAVRLQIDGQLVAHYIYSFKELEALRKGGVQRIYVGNIAIGDHKLDVLVDGKNEGGTDFSHTEHFTFRKEVKPKLLELTVADPRSGNTPIALGEW